MKKQFDGVGCPLQVAPGELKKSFLTAVINLPQKEQQELWNYLYRLGIIKG